MNSDQSFLGTGWCFPPAFNNNTGTVQMVAEAEDIEQSLKILLATRPGERVMQPRFGCNLEVLLFEPITTSLLAYVKDMIQTAILYYEPRIELDFVRINAVDDTNGLILISMEYTVLATNSRYNLVYPFYINEGAVQ
ncbi:GPW/gp25 family protein [Chitinophaga solisilvae]|uniref:GPW/gp25 family protein n=1 Tax=Chitinophaga solisilvae TaxID=1233460 RepID=A0A3S1B3E8_9BACT|nr:GPW/gp25 family protein [Chitinophaga solisilvae]NSL86356.1 GPW/gp25 family protein [Chitinophaga solisilvae]